MTEHVHIGDGEVQPTMPWPFPGGSFPQDLGAVVMRNVLSGEAAALQVVHFEDGYWGVADGRRLPSTRNLEATHIWHVISADRTIAELATLPPGHQADRDRVGAPWVISPHVSPAPTLWARIRERLTIPRFR